MLCQNSNWELIPFKIADIGKPCTPLLDATARKTLRKIIRIAPSEKAALRWAMFRDELFVWSEAKPNGFSNDGYRYRQINGPCNAVIIPSEHGFSSLPNCYSDSSDAIQ